jgi:hypothetical protein
MLICSAMKEETKMPTTKTQDRRFVAYTRMYEVS